MSSYRVEFLRSATRELGRLPPHVQQRIARHLDALPFDPRPVGVQALAGGAGLLRLRIGAYRVIYRVEEAAQLVLIVRIGHRREVYRRR